MIGLHQVTGLAHLISHNQAKVTVNIPHPIRQYFVFDELLFFAHLTGLNSNKTA